MKRVLFGLTVMLSGLACGSSDDTTQGLEIGTATEALTTSDGFGTLASAKGNAANQRCDTGGGTHGWTGGECDFPFLKSFHITLDTSGCGTFAADYAAAMQSAVAYVHGQLTSNGWVDNGAISRLNPGVSMFLHCAAPFAGDSGHSGTALQNIGGCSNTQFGKECFYTSTESRLYNTVLDAGDWAGATATQRRTYLNTVATHELGHAAGLGHEPCNDGTGKSWVMDAHACLPDAPPSAWSLNGFTSFEDALWRAYSR